MKLHTTHNKSCQIYIYQVKGRNKFGSSKNNDPDLSEPKNIVFN